MRTSATRGSVWFVAGFLFVQCAWILTVPPFRGIDEFDHAFRAAGVAHGQVVADTPVEDGRGLLVEVPPALVEAAHEQCAKLRYTGPDNCSAAGTTSDGLVLVGSGAATYHPAYYAVVGLVGRLADGAGSLYLMRVASALLCAVFVGLAAWAAGGRGTRWPTLALLVALTPTLAYSTIVVAPNGLEMAAAIALWVALLGATDEPDLGRRRRLVWLAVAAGVVMCSLRLLGPIFVLAAVLFSAALDPSGTRDLLRRHRRTVFAGAALVLGSALNLAWWIRGPGAAAVPSGGPGEDDVSLSAAHGALWVVQAIGAFPYRNQFAPAVVYLVVVVPVLVLLALLAGRAHPRGRALVWIALGTALVMPFAATALTSGSREGVIWQGRYGLPFAVGFLLLAGFALDRGDRRGPPVWLSALACVTAATATIISVLHVRSDELSDNPASVSDASWHVPSPWLLALIVLLAALGCWRALRSPSDRAGAADG